MNTMHSGSSDLSPCFALLGFLYFQPMHGYDLHRQLQAGLREIWHIRQSQVYATLKRMEREGWVTAVPQAQDRRPDRSVLHLTDAGRAQFESWLYTPTPSSARALRVEFLTRLFFACQIGEEVCARLLREQGEATRIDLERLKKRLDETPADEVFNRLGLGLRVRQLITMIEWLDSCELNLFPLIQL